MNATLEEKTKQLKHMENEAIKLSKELDKCRSTPQKEQPETPNAHKQGLQRSDSRQVLPSPGGNRKLYSSILAPQVETKHKVLIKSRANQNPETIKNLLKTKVNPTEIRVG